MNRPLLLFAKTAIRKIGIRAAPNTYIVLNQGSLSPTNCAATLHDSPAFPVGRRHFHPWQDCASRIMPQSVSQGVEADAEP